MEPMDHLDDTALLRRYASGRSQEAFVEFVRRHLNLVYRSALRQVQGDTHRAQDITQMVFVEVARKAPYLAGHPRLAGWLFTTTRFVTAATLRTERRRQLRESEAIAMHTQQSGSSPENWEEVRPVLDEVLQELNGSDREAVLLHYFEGRPFAEVGARLSLKEDAARMRVSRALEKLRKALTRRGVASSTAALAIMLTAESTMAAPPALLATAAAISGGIASSGASGLGIFHLMNTSKLAVSVAAGIGILLAGAGVYYAAAMQRDFIRVQAQMAATGDEIPRLKNRLAVATAEALVAEKQRAALLGGKSALSAVATTMVAKKPTLVRASFARDLQALAKSPAFEAAYLLNVRSRLGTTFVGLYQQLNLSQQQIDRFKDAFMKNAQAEFDVAASAADQGVALDDPAIATLYAKNGGQLAEDLKGIATVEQIDDYLRLQQRGTQVANQVSDALNYSETPLSSQQSAALVKLVSGHVNGAAGQIDWSSVTSQAAEFLSAAQLAILSDVQSKWQYNSAASGAMGQ